MQQAPVLARAEQTAAQLGELRAKAADLKLRLSDLDGRRTQLKDRYDRFQGAEADRIALGKELAGVNHDLTATQVQLETTTEQIDELTTQRDMARAFSLQQPPSGIPMTAPPDPFLGPNDIMGILTGGFVLMVPFVLVLARRLWIRSVPRGSLDPEESPRLQRIEQAIESIALEVERIGEAQRFTTKLLADRQPDAVQRLGVQQRREPGTITPH
jgi:DNA repair exonuclease SbcCD ATPase subunit